MKHTKMFFALVVLTAAVLAFGCNQANTPSKPNTTASGFTMNQQQQTAYNRTIFFIKERAASQAIPANDIPPKLQDANRNFAPFGFKVVDTQAGQPIEKGTTEDALKARFKPEKI